MLTTRTTVDKEEKIDLITKIKLPIKNIFQIAHLGGNRFAYCQTGEQFTDGVDKYVYSIDLDSENPEPTALFDSHDHRISLKRKGNLLLIKLPGVTYIWDIEKSAFCPKFINGGANGLLHSSGSDEIIACLQSTLSRVPLNKPTPALTPRYNLQKTISCSDIKCSDSRPIAQLSHPATHIIHFPQENRAITVHDHHLNFWDEKWNLYKRKEILGKNTIDLLAFPQTTNYILARKNNAMLLDVLKTRELPDSFLFAENELIVDLTLLPEHYFLVQTQDTSKSNQRSLHLMKLNNLKLEKVDTLTQNLQCFTVEDTGNISLLNQGSDELLRFNYPNYTNYKKVTLSSGEHQFFRRLVVKIPEAFPRGIVAIIADFIDPYVDMTPDYKADEDKAALATAQKVKAELPEDAIQAAAKGHLWSLGYLIEHDLVNPNQMILTGEKRPDIVKHTTLLIEALANKRLRVANSLLDDYNLTSETINQCAFEISKANTTVYRGNALSLAIQLGNLNLIKKLLKHGADSARCMDHAAIATVANKENPYIPAVVYAATCQELTELEKTKPGIRKQILQAILPFSTVELSKEQQTLIDSVLSTSSPAEAKSPDLNARHKKKFVSYDTEKEAKRKLEDKIQNCALEAAAKGYIQTLKYLFKEKLANPNQSFSTGEYRYYRTRVITTLLIEAIRHKQMGVATLLLEEYNLTPENINETYLEYHSSETNYFGNALSYAIQEGDLDLIRRLLLRGADDDACIDDRSHIKRTMYGGGNDPYMTAKEHAKTCRSLKKREQENPHIREEILQVIKECFCELVMRQYAKA
ncbi:MAG: hypothetical protein ACYCQI_05390 [Gammaproteobacteria bacterium]